MGLGSPRAKMRVALSLTEYAQTDPNFQRTIDVMAAESEVVLEHPHARGALNELGIRLAQTTKQWGDEINEKYTGAVEPVAPRK